jgi:hypothetical protein
MRSLGFGGVSDGGRAGIFFGLVVVVFLALKFIIFHCCPGTHKVEQGDLNAHGVLAAAGGRVSPNSSPESATREKMKRQMSNFIASQVKRQLAVYT